MPAPTTPSIASIAGSWTGPGRADRELRDLLARVRVDFPGKPSLKMSSAAVFRRPLIHDPGPARRGALGVPFPEPRGTCAREDQVIHEDDASGVMERTGGGPSSWTCS